MGANCLSRETIQLLARGRSQKRELAAARRHLAECPRCRAAVVAAAHGVAGPGDTVLLKRSGGALPRGVKVAAVAASILAAGAAWSFGKTTTAEPPRGEAHPVQLQVSLEPELSPPAGAGAALEAPASVEAAALAPAQEALGAPAPPQPVVRVLPASASEESPHDLAGAAPPERPSAAQHGATARKRQPVRASAARSGPRPPPQVESAAEYDFGIDELPAPARPKRAIRTSLD